jgi:hypothetical protein
MPRVDGDSLVGGALPRAYRDTTNPFRIPPRRPTPDTLQ